MNSDIARIICSHLQADDIMAWYVTCKPIHTLLQSIEFDHLCHIYSRDDYFCEQYHEEDGIYQRIFLPRIMHFDEHTEFCCNARNVC